jgi:hypothetical protein
MTTAEGAGQSRVRRDASSPEIAGRAVMTDNRAMPSDLAERAMAALVLAAAVALPLLFDPSLDDGYALPKISVLRILGLVSAALFLGYVAYRGSLARSADPRIDIPLACFAVLLVAASVASVDPVQSFAGEPYQYQGLVTVLLYVGSFYLARLSLGTPRGFRTILMATVGTGAVVSIYGIAQRIGFDPFWSGPPDDRIISSVGQPNDLAAYLDLLVIAALGLWPTVGKGARIALGAVVVVALVALALTFSRGGISVSPRHSAYWSSSASERCRDVGWVRRCWRSWLVRSFSRWPYQPSERSP